MQLDSDESDAYPATVEEYRSGKSIAVMPLR
jgi:hypothetical protein